MLNCAIGLSIQEFTGTCQNPPNSQSFSFQGRYFWAGSKCDQISITTGDKHEGLQTIKITWTCIGWVPWIIYLTCVPWAKTGLFNFTFYFFPFYCYSTMPLCPGRHLARPLVASLDPVGPPRPRRCPLWPPCWPSVGGPSRPGPPPPVQFLLGWTLDRWLQSDMRPLAQVHWRALPRRVSSACRHSAPKICHYRRIFQHLP